MSVVSEKPVEGNLHIEYEIKIVLKRKFNRMCLFKKKISKKEFEESLNPPKKVSDFYIKTERKTFDCLKEKAKSFSKAYKYIDTMTRDYITQAASSGFTFITISGEELKEELKRLDLLCLFPQIIAKLIDILQNEGFWVDCKKNNDIDIMWHTQGPVFGEEIEYL